MSAIVAFVTPNTGDYALLEFDVISGEDHSIGAQVTEHTVEEGANISDHVRPELIRLSLRAVVTDSPINRVTAFALSPAPLQGSFSPLTVPGRVSRQLTSFNLSGGVPSGLRVPGFVPVLGGFKAPGAPQTSTPVTVRGSEFGTEFQNVSGQFLQFSEPMQRVKAAFENLINLCHRGIPVEVTTDIRVYPRMLITSIGAPRDGSNSIEFSIELRELRTARTQNTFITRRPAPKPKEKRAAVEEPKGKQAIPLPFEEKGTIFSYAIDGLAGTGPL